MAIATGVKAFHPDYERLLPKWKRCRDVIAGQDAIHAAGVEYLPGLVDEPKLAYDARVARTPFFNASFRTVDSFVGMLFRKPPTLEASEKIKTLLEDVTMSGISFDDLAQDVVFEDFEVSRVGIFVDYPTGKLDDAGKPVSRTVAQAEQEGLRPSMTIYKAEAIRNWEHRRVNNRNVLAQVRLTDIHVTKVGEFQNRTEVRIKVLDLDEAGFYRIRYFKEENEEEIGSAIYPLLNNAKMREVPFYVIGPDSTADEADDPILIDLFDHNIKHYQVSADYEHACHMTALPTAYICGLQKSFGEDGKEIENKFYIGSGTAWVFPNPETKVDFLEYSGAGIGSIKANLDDKKLEMAAIGARALAPDKSGVEATTTLIMRSTGENSILGGVAIAVSRGLSRALDMFCRWAGEAAKSGYKINREFVPFSADPTSLGAWMALVQTGNMDRESLFKLMQRGDLLEADLTYEQMQAKIDSDPPLAPPIAVDPNAKDDDEDEDDDKKAKE